MQRLDALFVLNQSADSSSLRRACDQAGHRRVLVLTTHCSFDAERAVVERAAEHVAVLTFADLLTDASMASCDERAAAELAGSVLRPGGRRRYTTAFEALSGAHKNAAVLAALRERYSWDRSYYTPGLGVCEACWQAEGAAKLSAGETAARRYRVPSALSRLADCAGFFRAVTRLHRVDDGAAPYYFNTVKRLGFKPGAEVRSLDVGALAKLRAAWRARSIAPVRILRELLGPEGVVASTVHGYPYFFADDPSPVSIFADGFHPSNYPSSYLPQYGAGIFVTGDPLSAGWFQKFGRQVVAPPAFLAPEPMRPPAPPRGKTVLLALNHAGDWTALVNRSDTDVLVAAFCELARDLPDLDFVVRPHPTMAHAAHEGAGSRRRLESHVRACALPNLTASTATLAEDLERGDLFVSEYSQVLVDAFRLGKLGVIANLTARRSFMVDYEECGFAAVGDAAGLRAALAAFRSDPEPLRACQAAAAERYNALLARFVASGAA